jgi:putative acetyltransferase
MPKSDLEMITVRDEQAGDEAQIRTVNLKAFGQTAEADIVDTLRRTCPEYFSLVAENEGTIVGHILFTPALIEGQDRRAKGTALAPMAVLPGYQRKGIGSRLVRAGVEKMRDAGQPYIVVLGTLGIIRGSGLFRLRAMASRVTMRTCRTRPS